MLDRSMAVTPAPPWKGGAADRNTRTHRPMKTTHLRTLRRALAATAILTLSACGPDGGSTSELDGQQRSKHFDAVSAHLDLGGEVYGYIDVDGDVEKLASLLDEFVGKIREVAGDEIPPQLAAMDFEKLAADLGLSSVDALGVSSYRNGELHRNKYYLHAPGGRTGLLKIAGGDPAPFAARKLAPSGSDLIYEQDLDLKSAFELAGDLVGKIGGPEAAGEFRKATAQPLPDVGLSAADVFAQLDTKIVVVGHLDTGRKLDLPEEVPVSIPGVDLLVSVDGIGPLFAKLIESIPPDQRGEFLEEGEGYQQFTAPLPPEIAAIIQPVVRHETGSGRVLVATSAAYLERCLAGESTVWDDAGFEAAMEGLPEEGNGLGFVSAKFSKEYLRIYDELFKAMAAEGEVPAGLGEMAIGLIEELGLSPDHSQARVIANLPEGILISENAAASAKQGVVAAAVGTAAVLAGMTFWNVSAAEAEVIELQEARDIEIETLEAERRAEIRRDSVEREGESPPAQESDSAETRDENPPPAE